jgi:acyl-CoA oxidase
MRFCKVDREGNISIEGDPRILYATMMSIRVWLIVCSWKESSTATVIGTRYSCVRRQFPTTSDKKERKLLDYQAHQFKIIPAVAQSLVFNFAQNHIRGYYEEFISMIQSGASENFKPLAVIHHLVSGLKAFFT